MKISSMKYSSRPTTLNLVNETCLWTRWHTKWIPSQHRAMKAEKKCPCKVKQCFSVSFLPEPFWPKTCWIYVLWHNINNSTSKPKVDIILINNVITSVLLRPIGCRFSQLSQYGYSKNCYGWASGVLLVKKRSQQLRQSPLLKVSITGS